LYADGSFRTEMATRYAQHAQLVDYAYRGLPAYYPPAVAWVEGRLAALTGLPAWEVIKPVQLVFAVLVPLLAYMLWQRVLPPLMAAAVMATSVALTVNVQKPDEWLVLSCIVPWWIDLVRDRRRPGVPPWPAWRHGVVAGLLLLTHTFFFLPVAVASALALAVDLRRGGRLPLRPTRALVVAAVAAAVSSPYWIGMVASRLSGAPRDNLQMRYTYPGANVPHAPLPIDLVGALGLLGLLWLGRCWWVRRRGGHEPLAGPLTLLLAGALLTMLAGQVATWLGVGLLTFKTQALVMALYAATGVLALRDGTAWWTERVRRTGPGRRLRPGVWPALVVVVAAVLVVHDYVDAWVVGTRALVAQTTRYPDGTWPAGRHGHPPELYPSGVRPGDPSVRQVVAAWDRASGSRPLSASVLVASRVDLLATTPVHPFVAWKSIYSNPLGQFDARLALLHRVSACPDAGCAERLLRGNRFDRVDGLVLNRRGHRLLFRVNVDNFPDRTRETDVVFPARLFDGAGFRRVDVGPLSVVALR
jgi:galactan 5-O-arabinofuranosyltransferase